MKKRFFTSNTFKFFVALSIVLGVFLTPIKFIVNPNDSLIISTQKNEVAAGDISYYSAPNGYQTETNKTTGVITYYDNRNQIITKEKYDAGVAANEKQISFWKDPMAFIASGLLGIILKGIAYILLVVRAIAGMMLVISAKLLDWTLGIAIGFNYDDPNIGAGIFKVWTIVRDIFNVFFVFVLLWAGISQIIGKAGNTTKQIIIGVVISGLLINFSMFFTRVLIDASNTVSTALYNQVVSVNGEAKSSLTAGLANGLGIPQSTQGTRLFGEGKDKISSNNNTEPVGILGIIILFVLQIAIYSIAAFAFFSVCILFIGRIVTLILLLALSPLGFLGPGVKTMLSKVKALESLSPDWWWKEFTAQLFIIPIFLLLIIITLVIAKGFGTTDISTMISGNGEFTGAASSFAMLLNFSIIIFLILKTVEITKKSSGSVGQMVNGLGSKVVGFGLGVATGGVALAGRQVIGRLANSQLQGARGEKLRADAASGSIRARMQLATYEKASKSTYDARNVESVRKVAGVLSKQTGINMDMGKTSGIYGKETGFAGARQAQQERENEIYNKLDKSVTGKQRLAANTALQARDTVVKGQLDGAGMTVVNPATGISSTVFIDPVTGYHTGGSDVNYNNLRNQKTDYLRVRDNHKDLVNEQAAFADAKTEKEDLETRSASIMATGTTVQKAEHKKALSEAKRIYNDAARTKDKKVKEIQEELKKKYAGEIAALDDQMKAIKTKAEKKVENDPSVITAPEKAQLDVVNKARNYADSVREGRTGKWTSMARAAKLAEGMETQHESK
ncbi:MAG: hypothetical protein WCC74_01425 [Minisyncoccia bacterium]